MNAPENKRLQGTMPQCLRRDQPARFAWWSDRRLMIVKGEDTLQLDADDVRDLARFVESCNAERDL